MCFSDLFGKMLKISFDGSKRNFDFDSIKDELFEVFIFFFREMNTLIGSVLFVFGELISDTETDIRHIIASFFDSKYKFLILMFGSV